MSKGTPPGRRRPFDDRTARARIRDAAIERFAVHGVAAANLKDIAADAGVSTPLVIHHFGSKDGLRAACDEYVVSMIREQKSEAMAAGRNLDPFQVLRAAYEGTPILRYLAKRIADSSPHVDELIDELIEDSLVYTAQGVENGILTPTENPRERVIVLTLWQLGTLVLHEQLKRLLNVDLIDDSTGSVIRWARITAEILAKGVIVEEFYEQWRDAMEAAERQAEHHPRNGTDRETT